VNLPPEIGAIAQAIKHQIRSGKFWNDLTPTSKESLDQIASLIAHTVSSEGTHWDGIIGFAQAALPAPSAEPTINIERDIRRLAREIPQRNQE
jgi:hypothetical protein